MLASEVGEALELNWSNIFEVVIFWNERFAWRGNSESAECSSQNGKCKPHDG